MGSPLGLRRAVTAPSGGVPRVGAQGAVQLVEPCALHGVGQVVEVVGAGDVYRGVPEPVRHCGQGEGLQPRALQGSSPQL